WDGDRGGPTDRRGPPPIVAAVVVAAVIATIVAYRRIGGPVSELLGGAQRIGAGDYDARVRPYGPRTVRTLGHAFNDMAQRLDRAEDTRRRFLADVSHELRTPLTVLQAEIEAQLDGVHPRDDDHLTTLLEQTGTLGRLVDDLRTLALGEAGRLDLHAEAVAPAAVAIDAVAAMRATADRREVALIVDAPDGGVEIDADPVRLGQVLTNLLGNAIRHTPPGGTVTVSVRTTTSAVHITVTDTGEGLGDDPDRHFDRFARAADSGGSGLGLAIARQLVERHDGRLTAANRPGGGAVFEVALPRPSSTS
ncbi:MAG: HAMP domain-containing histidine kinase, partial [Acidimicrobiia bacterium]|nr:HAMP domain-containing histidine kinase [Acidimicrobiia bacterium]